MDNEAGTGEVMIGSRILSDDGHFATVLYIGAVQSTKGEWFGVEWDSADRGKHNGLHQGTRYFTTRKPEAGSFIRAKRIVSGTRFFKQLTERYGVQEEGNAGVRDDELFVVGDSQGTGQITRVEMVGAQKVNLQQSQLSNLQVVVLRDARIRGIEPALHLSKLTPNIVDLNLSKNLLCSWEDLATIADHLTQLTTLNVSENRLQDPKNIDKLKNSFSSLRTLMLNRMDEGFLKFISWSAIWPNLQEIHLCFNGIENLCEVGSAFRQLKLLNLEGNPLKNWMELNHLKGMKLESLILNDTGLETIGLETNQSLFPCLNQLLLCHNRIKDWSSINELNKIKTLKVLKLNGNPLMKLDREETVRDLVIAKISSLTLLNRTEILSDERLGADFSYVKRFGHEWLKAGGSPDPEKNSVNECFLREHPRYSELVATYGAADLSEMYKDPQGLKDSLISVTIKSVNKSVKKKLPMSMTVQKLKTLIQRLFKADISNLKLVVLGEDDKGPNVELDNDLRELSFFSLTNDDVIQASW